VISVSRQVAGLLPLGRRPVGGSSPSLYRFLGRRSGRPAVASRPRGQLVSVTPAGAVRWSRWA